MGCTCNHRGVVTRHGLGCGNMGVKVTGENWTCLHNLYAWLCTYVPLRIEFLPMKRQGPSCLSLFIAWELPKVYRYDIKTDWPQQLTHKYAEKYVHYLTGKWMQSLHFPGWPSPPGAAAPPSGKIKQRRVTPPLNKIGAYSSITVGAIHEIWRVGRRAMLKNDL